MDADWGYKIGTILYNNYKLFSAIIGQTFKDNFEEEK